MRMSKRIIAFLLTLCMIFVSFPLAISAADTITGTIGDNISWTLDDATGVLTLTGSGAMDGKYTTNYTANHPWYSQHRNKIRKVYIGEGITSISENCFYDCDSLTYVSFPSTLETLEESSFVSCGNLRTVDLPVSLKNYGNNAFRNTSPNFFLSVSDIRHWLSIEFKGNPPMVAVNGSIINNLVIPEGVTEIKDYAFAYNKELLSVTIPDSVETIGRFAFESCSSLKSVTLGTGIKSIGGSCFSSCKALTDVYIKDAGAFANIDFTVQSSNPLYLAENLYLNGTLVEDISVNGNGKISKYAFLGYEKLKSVTVGEGVTSIGDYAFADCIKLEYVTLSDTVETLGNYVFSGCTFLRQPTFGKGLCSIGDYAFENCHTYFYEIYLPEGLEEVGKYLFNNNRFLTAVHLPSTLKKINGPLSMNTWNVVAYHIEDISAWLKIEFSNDYSHEKTVFPVLYLNGEPLRELTVPEDITVIPDNCFKNYGALESVVFHEGVTTVGDNAFSGCNALQRVDFKNSHITEIGDFAFSGCTNLRDLELPHHVQKLGASAFSNCQSITSLEIPYTLKTIGNSAFGGCSNLKRVVIHEGLKTINTNVFSGCISLKEITIPETVNYIKSAAFYQCYSLETINFAGSEYRWKTVTVVERDSTNADLGYATVVYNYETPINVSLYGDVNDDGKINAVDSNLMKHLIMGKKLGLNIPERILNALADVNRDGVINGVDSNILKRIITGLE